MEATAVIDPRAHAFADPSSGHPAPVHARWLGQIDYREAYAFQKRLVDQRANDQIGDQLLLLEHPAVLTLGRNSDPAHVLASPAELAARVSVHRLTLELLRCVPNEYRNGTNSGLRDVPVAASI